MHLLELQNWLVVVVEVCVCGGGWGGEHLFSLKKKTIFLLDTVLTEIKALKRLCRYAGLSEPVHFIYAWRGLCRVAIDLEKSEKF